LRSYFAGGVSIDAVYGSGSGAGLLKVAIGYDTAGRSVVANNGSVVSDATLPGARAQIFLCQDGAGAAAFYNGYIARIGLGPSRLADAALKASTV
jgi:hypothetical protein